MAFEGPTADIFNIVRPEHWPLDFTVTVAMIGIFALITIGAIISETISKARRWRASR